MSIRTIKTHDGKPIVILPVQSPELCDLCDQHGLHGYRDDYRDTITYTVGGYCFPQSEQAAADFITAAQPMVDSALAYMRQEKIDRETENAAEIERYAKQAATHAARIERDAANISNLPKFTGGKTIVVSISTPDYLNDLDDEYWIGKTGTCISTEDVSPNALRDHTGEPHYYVCDHSNAISGNSNRNITRYFGWRGTTDDKSCNAHGVRMIYKIVQFKFHARVYISKYNPEYQD